MSAFRAATYKNSAQHAVDPALLRIRDVVYKVAGIFHSDEKLHLLGEGCQRRMRDLAARSLDEYLDALTANARRDEELRRLLDEITVAETSFFRYPNQMEALRRVVLPALVQLKAHIGFTRLRIWSAGCGTGEEPYTLAMVVAEEAAGLLKGWSVEILATDLSESALAQARAGVYQESAVRNTPPLLRQKYLQLCGSQFQVTDSLKSLVTFSRLNLLDDSKMLLLRSIDVILCCNVMIYFDGAARRRVLLHFRSILAPNGYLFLGPSESLFGMDGEFRLVHFPGCSAYVTGAARSRVGGAL